MMKGVAQSIFDVFSERNSFTLKEAYRAAAGKPETTVCARIYENLGILFKRVGNGVYAAIRGEQECILIEENGRDLSMLKDESIDCIITDHPWLDKASNVGGNRSFADYECFGYEKTDFAEKARVLKPGACLAEFLTLEGEIILDQYAGSGAVGVAALRKKRRCILIEKSHEYTEKIRERIESEFSVSEAA